MDWPGKLDASVEHVRARLGAVPNVGVVLGSGWGHVLDSMTPILRLDYAGIPQFPRPSVPGHAGELVVGRIGKAVVVCMKGRPHLYEGLSPHEVVHPVRVLCRLGVLALIVTSASGGIHPDFNPGDFMLITDHINLTGQNPLAGPNDDRLGPRFPDMTEAYDAHLSRLALDTARELDIPLRRGTYLGVAGPNYETPAEIRMFQALGADAVGMSTVLEVIAARHLGVRVCGISCITNKAAGLGQGKLSHEEVIYTVHESSAKAVALLTGIITAVGDALLG